jgi:hypothetical protein
MSGLANIYPGRGYPQAGSNSGSMREVPAEWVGGARGPSGLPSRTINSPPPASAAPWPLKGAHGPNSHHRGPFIEDAGAPRLCYDNIFGHTTIPWSRPTYANRAGLASYRPPTQQPSWTANTDIYALHPTVPIPVQNKRIGSFTVRRPYGDNSSGTEFNGRSLAPFVDALPTGMNMQGRRWLRQSQTANPHLVNRATYGTAGSYGQTTRTLATQPSNLPAVVGNGMGAY